jgi:pyruvate/2-oxoglutarate/acetoin dehydrogenase E1 component
MQEQRIISYPEAINEALLQVMEKHPNSVVMGEGVDDPKRILGTTKGLEKFGKDRFFDTPIAEEGMTGVAIGIAMAGNYVVHNHIRQDFLLLAMNQIVNMATKAHYMYGGKVTVPLTIRACIGKSWGQGPQHSQSLYPLFMNIPGLKIVAPTTPYDAKGLLTRAILDENPVLFIEHRHLYYQKGHVPEEYYEIPIGTQRYLYKDSSYPQVTLVGVSQMAVECLRASKILKEQTDANVDIIDMRSLSPMDLSLIEESLYKTKALVFVDCAWTKNGAGSEVITQLMKTVPFKFEFKRMGFAETVCPTSKPLEDAFYPDAYKIAKEAHILVNGKTNWYPEKNLEIEEIEFKGPF